MLLERYRSRFEKELPLAIEQMGEKNVLRDACEYALVCGGKRLRPLIVLMTADALAQGLDVLPAALSVEFFHTASLIADDLPCMDNDDFRRNRPSLHKAFGESIAILASYTLIAEGYGGIHRNGERMKQDARFAQQAGVAALRCLKAATLCAGSRGRRMGSFSICFLPIRVGRRSARSSSKRHLLSSKFPFSSAGFLEEAISLPSKRFVLARSILEWRSKSLTTWKTTLRMLSTIAK